MTEYSQETVRGTFSAARFDELIDAKGQAISPVLRRRARRVLVEGVTSYQLAAEEGISQQSLGRQIKKVYLAITAGTRQVLLQVPDADYESFVERYKEWVVE